MSQSGNVGPGTLLVATSSLLDPNFAETVVMLLDADGDGALGVILNRPSAVLVSDILEPWSEVVDRPEVLFRGGPVGLDGALAVGLLRDPADVPLGWRAVVGRLGILDLDTPAELVEGSLAGLRVFAGYAGWGAQQLRDEIAEGSWYVVPVDTDACAGDVFADDTTTLRRDVLRRQPGTLAWHATRPVDPDLN